MDGAVTTGELRLTATILFARPMRRLESKLLYSFPVNPHLEKVRSPH
jgi:hypothetical protein